METGIRKLRDNLSRYIRRTEAGEVISVTAHGRVVAELVPPSTTSRVGRRSRYDELIATGVIRPALEGGIPSRRGRTFGSRQAPPRRSWTMTVATRSVRGARATRRVRRAVRPPAAPAALETRYIDSSALVAALLERDAAARAALRVAGRRVTSALTLAEASRVIVHARASGRLSPAEERAAIRAVQVFARRCDLVAVTDAILNRVGRRFPVEPVRTLDAVHLATAEAFDEPPPLVTIVTRDARVRDNARAFGYRVE